MGRMIDAREALAEGRSARVRPRGHSMSGVIEDNHEVCIEPVDPSDVQAGDVVFLAWKQSYLLHIAYELDGEQVLIGNARGRMNGWTDPVRDLGPCRGSPSGAQSSRTASISLTSSLSSRGRGVIRQGSNRAVPW